MKKNWIVIIGILSFIIIFPVFAETDEIAKADQLWQNHQTQGMTEKAITVLEAFIEKEPENYEALWRLTRYYQFLGAVSIRKERATAYEKGLAYGERAIKANNQGVNGLVWHAILLGSSLQEKKDLNSLALVNKMQAELQSALALDPKQGNAHYALAQLYYSAPGKPLSIGDKKKALQEAELAVKYTPENIDTWMFYGWLLMGNKDFNAGREAFAKYLDGIESYRKYSVLINRENQTADDYETLWHLSHFYQFAGENCPSKPQKLLYLENGLTYAEKAIKINPQGVEGHLYRAILMGDIGLEKGILKSLAMVQPMNEELKKVLEIDPENATAHYVISQLYWKVPGKPLSIGDKKKALTEAALAVKYNPQDIKYWLDYGKIALDNKDQTTARTAFTKVVGFFGEYGYYKAKALKELDKLGKD